jgi:hypothetical protein
MASRRKKREQTAIEKVLHLQNESAEKKRAIDEVLAAGTEEYNATEVFIANSISEDKLAFALSGEYPAYSEHFLVAKTKFAELAISATKSKEIAALRVKFWNQMNVLAERCIGQGWSASHLKQMSAQNGNIPRPSNLIATQAARNAMAPAEAPGNKKRPAAFQNDRRLQQSLAKRRKGLHNKLSDFTSRLNSRDTLLITEQSTAGNAKSALYAERQPSSEATSVTQLDGKIDKLVGELRDQISLRASQLPYTIDPTKNTGLTMVTDVSNKSFGDLLSVNVASPQGSPILLSLFHAMYNPSSSIAKRGHESRRPTGGHKRMGLASSTNTLQDEEDDGS